MTNTTNTTHQFCNTNMIY